MRADRPSDTSDGAVRNLITAIAIFRVPKSEARCFTEMLVYS